MRNYLLINDDLNVSRVVALWPEDVSESKDFWATLGWQLVELKAPHAKL